MSKSVPVSGLTLAGQSSCSIWKLRAISAGKTSATLTPSIKKTWSGRFAAEVWCRQPPAGYVTSPTSGLVS